MIHRYLHQALTDGLKRFSQDPGLFNQLFVQLFGLAQTEVDAVRKRFLSKPPRIEHAYSPDAATMPCYAIVMGNEQQAQAVLGNTAGYFSTAITQKQPVFSTVWRHNYTVLCYAQQPDFVEYMYEMAKASLYFQTDYFLQQGLMEVSLAGQELSMDERAPERMFNRALTFSCAREFRFFSKDAPTQPYGVDGIFVDDGVQNGKVGITARVTPVPDATGA